MEKNERDPEPRPPENTPRQTGNNFIWYALAIGAATLLLVGFWPMTTRVALSYGDLVRLIEQGAPERKPDASIDVTVKPEKSGDEPLRIRYSKLTDVKIGRYEVTGKVTREVLAPKTSKPSRSRT